MEESIKITVKGVIPPRDAGLRKLIREYQKYKKVLIPRVRDAVRRVVKDKSITVYAQQKWQINKKLHEYLKNLPFHPMPFHNQSVYIENEGGCFRIHFKTKEGEAACHLHVPAKYRSLIEKACSSGFAENPILGQVELIEDKKYGWVNCHITLRLPKPEPYKPKGWVGVDVGFCKLATSILAVPCVTPRSLQVSDFNFTPRSERDIPHRGLWALQNRPSLKHITSSLSTQELIAQGINAQGVQDCNEDVTYIKFSHPTFHGKEFKTRIIQLRRLLKEYARKGKAWKKWDYRLKHAIKYAVGVVAKEIVSKAEKLKAGVAMEKLTFKSTTKGYLVPRYKLMIAVKTLCEREGIPFKLVPAQYTSITCPKCNYRDKNNRNGEWFKCQKCGYQTDADLAGAMNISLKALTDTQMEGVMA